MKSGGDPESAQKPWTPQPQAVAVPSGIPRRRRVPDTLGPGACSFRMRLRDDLSGRGLDVHAECPLIVLVDTGRLLVDCGNGALVLRPGQAAGLLPGLCSWAPVGAPGEPALVTVAVLPDGAVSRLLDEGGLWQFFLNLAARSLPMDAADLVCPLTGYMGLAADSFIPGHLCEGLLKWLGGHPYDEAVYRFLARGALRHRVGEPEGEVPEGFILYDPGPAVLPIRESPR